MNNSRKGDKVIKKAIKLYREEINGKRVYTVPVITQLLNKEFGVTVNRSTVYNWVKIYDRIKVVQEELK